MPHPLFAGRGNRRKSAEEIEGQRQLKRNQYIGEVFVGRRKVWEGRAPTEAEAFAAAKHQQELKYKNANSNVQVRKTKVKGDA